MGSPDLTAPGAVRPRPHSPQGFSSRFRAVAARLWPWGCALLSGFLLALCYPRFDQTWLCWVALTPLIAAVWFAPRPQRRAWLRVALYGHLTAMAFFTTTFWWLGGPLADLFRTPWLYAIPFLLAAYFGLYFGAWAWFLSLLPRGDYRFLSSMRNLRIAFFASGGWIVQEWLRGCVLGGFGWNQLGVALHLNLPLIQIADFCGIFGLSFLVIFANVIAVITVRRFIAEVGVTRVRPHWDFSFLMAAIAGAFAYGVHALQHPVAPSDAISLTVACIQPCIPEAEKNDPDRLQAIVDRYDGLTHTAMAMHPQLLIWPEAATPGGDFFERDTNEFVRGLAAETDASFLAGSLLSTPSEGEFNIAVLLTNHGRDLQLYRKIHLVPFGEYVPLRDTFPLFARIAGELVPGDLRPGHDYTVFHLDAPPLRFAPLICFEDTLGDLTRRFVANGAQLLINITNDAWFLRSPGAQQHLANAVFRAVENRRPLIRAANTGVSCIIDSQGRILDQLLDSTGSPFTEGILFNSVMVPLHGPTTFYTRFGDWVVVLSFALTFTFLMWHFMISPPLRPSA